MHRSIDSSWQEQIELAQVPKGYWPGVYILGTHAARITFADQQKRALNLLSALVASGRLRPSDELGIIGAGIAGVTAAAYAARLRLVPTVMEQHDEPMMIQHGSGRWIHPNLYDWPRPNWKGESTAFPCMNWRANSAGVIVAQLRHEWSRLVADGLVRWCGATRFHSLRREDEFWSATDEKGREYGRWKAVVLAVGFGEEQQYSNIDQKSYWRDDDLHQRIRSGGRVLVSGCGDGGLIDAIRCLFLDFRHEEIASVATIADATGVSEQLIEIEADRPRYPDGVRLTDAYLQVKAPEVDDLLMGRIKKNMSVVLNGRGDAPFSRTSSPLNRFLVARLMQMGKITYLRGSLDGLSSVAKVGGVFPVHIDGAPHSFEHIVVRHGPREPPIDVIHEIGNSLGVAKQFLAAYPFVVDRTRQPVWEKMPLPGNMPMSSGALSRSASPDPRVIDSIAEHIHGNLRSHFMELRGAVLIRRELDGDAIILHAETYEGALGAVRLCVRGNAAVDVRVERADGREVLKESIAPKAGVADMDGVSSALRNAAFLLVGRVE
ncbi:FAD-dependent oxidoreductase [Corallococcus coralloides]|uniref:FAD-dependent oxidoreductase n=1 Tax=Corallococcus coralloides TaxID=184914 RepID=UPI00384FC4D8